MLTRLTPTSFRPMPSSRLGCGGWDLVLPDADEEIGNDAIIVPSPSAEASMIYVNPLEMTAVRGLSGRLQTRRGLASLTDSRFSPAFKSGIGCSSCNKANGFPTTLELQAQELEEQRMVGLGCSKCKRTRKQALLMYELDGRKPRVVMGQVCPLQAVDPSTVNCQRTSTGDVICSNGFIYSGSCPRAPQPNLPGIAEDVNGIPKIPPAPGVTSPNEPITTTGTVPGAAPAGGAPSVAVGALAIGGVAALLAFLS